MDKEFRARIEITSIVPNGQTTWSVQGKVVDVTGAFSALDVTEKDKIIQRGFDVNGRMTYDRYSVVAIEGRNAIDISLTIQNDTDAIKSASGMPATGSFPIGSENWFEKLTTKASFYQNQFDPDYDAGIDNLNLQELIIILRDLDCNHIKGGHHCYASISERDSIAESLRMWGMHCSVFNDPSNSFKNGNYELVFNYFSSDITDNRNWRRLDKNVFEITDVSSGSVPAAGHKVGTPIAQFYKAVGTGFFAAQLQYEITATGDLAWTANQKVTGYLVLV